jgi:hypothetical protein
VSLRALAATFEFNFGQRAFAYSAPTNFKAINTASLPTPTIADGSKYFDTKLWTGNGLDNRAITGYNFSPDFAWVKVRNQSYNHNLQDVVQGTATYLSSNTTSAETAETRHVKSFDSNGFTLGTGGFVNGNNDTYVGWAWDGGNGNKTYAITVANPGSGNKFYADGALQPTLTLAEGSTYKFDQSASSNASHPLRFSTTNNGTHGGGSEYTTGVTTAGTPGSAGAFTQIVIAASAPTLYAYCTAHSGMGFQINTSDKGGYTIPVGGLNSSVYNQSQTWSNGTAGGTGSFTPAITTLFDGDISTGPSALSGTSPEFTFTTPISFSTKVELYSSNGSGTGYNNGGTNSNAYFALKSNGSWHTVNGAGSQWIDVTALLTTNIQGLKINVPSGWGSGGLKALRVDGKVLVNNGVTPSNVPSIASQVMASPESGFSIVTFTGSANGTVGHGLNAAPALIIAKSRTENGYSWGVYHQSIGDQTYLYLNSTNGIDSGASNYWSPGVTNTTFGQGTSSNTAINKGNMIAYCFAPVAGYSAMGSYVGNGSSSGPFIHTGFRPSWVMIKKSSSASDTFGWYIIDSKRDTYNAADSFLAANGSNTENSNAAIHDLLSTGFKVRNSSQNVNHSGQTFIYIAVAENPFQANGGLAR